jgi:uncharacterized protein
MQIWDVIRTITQKIVEEYQPEKVILFGSYAYGAPDEESDIDLLIIKETPDRPIDRRVKVRQMVSPYRKGLAFSPLVFTPAEIQERIQINDPFFIEILGQGKVLYAK